MLQSFHCVRIVRRPTALVGVALLAIQGCHGTPPADVAPAGRVSRRGPPPAGMLEAANLLELRWEVPGPPPSARYLDPERGVPVALSDSVVLDMAGIDSAWVWRAPRDTADRWYVVLRLSRSAAASFGATTAMHVGRRLAVIVDGRVTEMPEVGAPLGASVPLAPDVPRAAADSLAARFNASVVALRPYQPVLLHRP